MFSEELEKIVSRRTHSLKESNIALEHSNRNLEQFAFIASHDLQEPLRKILLFFGLALCKKIVTHHNGEILAESREEGGALFRIILPLEHHGGVEKLLPGYVQ